MWAKGEERCGMYIAREEVDQVMIWRGAGIIWWSSGSDVIDN